MNATVSLDDLCIEGWPAEDLPWMDRDTGGPPGAPPAGLLRSEAVRWRSEGWARFPGLIPDHLIGGYTAEWRECVTDRGGWPDAIPYTRHSALRELCCYGPLAGILEWLIGEPMAVHLNLTGWQSTTRNWHQDGYLNPDCVRDWYAAVWVALDDIHPDAGPFQFVAGSHRWPIITQQRMLDALTPEEASSPAWPTHTERILTPLFEEKLAREQWPVTTWLPERGDVLIWHARLLHRGSSPRDPNLERRALIAHYSGVGHRPDMPAAVRHDAGGWWFPLAGRQPVR